MFTFYGMIDLGIIDIYLEEILIYKKFPYTRNYIPTQFEPVLNYLLFTSIYMTQIFK